MGNASIMEDAEDKVVFSEKKKLNARLFSHEFSQKECGRIGFRKDSAVSISTEGRPLFR